MKTPYTQKEANKIIKEVCKASDKLQILDHISWTNYWSNVVDAEYKEEKKHRSDCPYDNKWTCSAKDASKLLCLQHIFGYTLGFSCYYPDVDDYLHTKKTCFECMALAVNYTNEIIDAIEGIDVELILDADYCRFSLSK